jgi:threonine dehydrogenase-like Zn-dependent dehydrogenase
MGHEFCGTIVLGNGVSEDYLGNHLKVGDKVVVPPGVTDYSDYKSVICHAPTTSLTLFAYGTSDHQDKVHHFDGGFAEYVFLRDPRTKVLKSNLPAEILCLTEPFAMGVVGVDRACIKLGDSVVIQGSGPIGTFTTLCAKLSGAGKIINVGGPTKDRVELMKKFGADTVINIAEISDRDERVKLVKEETRMKFGADVVIDCTGVSAAVPEGLDMLRQSGTFVEVGSFAYTGLIEISPFHHLCNKNVNIQGVWGDDVEHMLRALSILEKREYPYEELATHVVGLNQLNEAIRFQENNYTLFGKEVGKIQVDGSKY